MHIVNIYLFTNNTGKAIILVPLFDNGYELHICNSMSIISRNLSVLFQNTKMKDNIVRNKNSVLWRRIWEWFHINYTIDFINFSLRRKNCLFGLIVINFEKVEGELYVML